MLWWKMSFRSYKSVVSIGDNVFVYLGPNNIYPLRVESGQVFQTKYGALRHDQLVGRPYGSVVNCAKGFVHILYPTPELWTLSLPHRTQILYSTDISLICIQLDLKPGSVVCEAGTGSGSLSHAIARTIAPNGRLISYDFHEERVAIARQEFIDHGLSDVIDVSHRDVCSNGFAFSDHFDALFLDLPHPWIAIPFAKESLKSNGGRICCFSPCIEQVQKTCAALTESQFFDIETYECVLRPYEVKEQSMPVYQFSTEKASSDQTMDTNSEPKPSKRIKTEDNLIEANDERKEYLITYLPVQSAGHTGFLTVAVKYV